MNTVTISIPEDFDFRAAVGEALKETLAPVGRLEMLKCKPFLTGKEVEDLYGLRESSLRTMRNRGGGPEYHQAFKGATVLYEHGDIMNFQRKTRIRG